MSFSKSFRGTAAIVLAAIAAFPAEQKETDAGSSKGVVDGHAKQIEAASKSINAALTDVPPDTDVDAGIWGHANDDGSGNYGYKIQVSSIPTAKLE